MGSFGKTEDLSIRYGLVYARVSSRKQKNEGHGLESQEERCLQALRSENIPYEKSFLDSYTGGADFMRRHAMRELLEYIDNNPHKNFLVIFDDLKRFARDTTFHRELRSAFKVRDTELKCLNYNFDESPEDIHSGFEELLMQIRASESLIDLSVVVFEDCWKNEMRNKESIKSSYTEDIEKLREKIEQLITLASKTEVETVIKQYEKQIEKYGKEIEELEAKTSKDFDYTIPYRTSSKEVLEVLQNPYSVWKNYNVYQKQKFFSFIFEENLRYDKIEGYRTPNYSLPITIFELVNTSKSEDLETMGVEPMSKSVI